LRSSSGITGSSDGDLRLAGVLAHVASVFSTLRLVLAGGADGCLALWVGCALVVAGALVTKGLRTASA
jgi:hypothetical protein